MMPMQKSQAQLNPVLRAALRWYFFLFNRKIAKGDLADQRPVIGYILDPTDETRNQTSVLDQYSMLGLPHDALFSRLEWSSCAEQLPPGTYPGQISAFSGGPVQIQFLDPGKTYLYNRKKIFNRLAREREN
jgi:hypothetical protein